jgi:hypothetical protein
MLDFERPEYAVILDHADRVERVDNLILVRRRKPWTHGSSASIVRDISWIALEPATDLTS